MAGALAATAAHGDEAAAKGCVLENRTPSSSANAFRLRNLVGRLNRSFHQPETDIAIHTFGLEDTRSGRDHWGAHDVILESFHDADVGSHGGAAAGGFVLLSDLEKTMFSGFFPTTSLLDTGLTLYAFSLHGIERAVRDNRRLSYISKTSLEKLSLNRASAVVARDSLAESGGDGNAAEVFVSGSPTEGVTKPRAVAVAINPTVHVENASNEPCEVLSNPEIDSYLITDAPSEITENLSSRMTGLPGLSFGLTVSTPVQHVDDRVEEPNTRKFVLSVNPALETTVHNVNRAENDFNLCFAVTENELTLEVGNCNLSLPFPSNNLVSTNERTKEIVVGGETYDSGKQDLLEKEKTGSTDDRFSKAVEVPVASARYTQTNATDLSTVEKLLVNNATENTDAVFNGAQIASLIPIYQKQFDEDITNVHNNVTPMPTFCAVSSPFILKRLNHVAVICENLEKSLRFYCGILGLVKNNARPELPYRGAWLFMGSGQIHIMEVPNPDPVTGRPAHGGYDRHTCMDINKVEPLREIFEREGIPYQISIVPSIFARDPDGNGLEFFEVED